MKKSLIFSAILLSMSASAFASSNAVDNVVGGDANGKDGYKTGVHINNAGSGTGLADELVIDRTASGVTISTDPYNGQNADLHKVVDLTSKEYVDQKNSDQDRNINALAGENATQNKQIVELQNSKADVTYVDQKIANIKQGDQIVNNDNSGRGSVDNSVGTVGNGGKVTINNTMTGPITGSVNNSACGSVAAGGHCEVTNTTVNQKVDFDKLTEEQKKQIRGEQGAAGKDGLNGKDGVNGTNGVDGKDGAAGKDGLNGKDGVNGTNGVDGKDGAAGKDGLAKVDGDTGVVGTHGGKEFDLSSQKELDAEASKRADADAALEAKKADKAEVAAAEQRASDDATAKTEAAKQVSATALKAEATTREAADAKIVADQKVTDDDQDSARIAADAALEAKKADKAAVVASEERAKSHTDKVVGFESVAREAADAELSSRIKAGDAALNSYKSATNGRLDGIDRTNARQDRQLADHEGRIGNLEQGVATLQEDVDHLKSGLAGTVAIATLVEPRYKGDTSLAVGVGVYQDAQALAVGLTHHFDNGVSGKIAVAADPAAFSDTVVAGASVGYSW